MRGNPAVPRWWPRFALAALVAVATLTAACFGGGNEPAPTPEATPIPTAATPTPDPTPVVQWPPIATARITTDDLNVRTGPGTQHAILGRLQPGAEVRISGRAAGGRWLAIPGAGWIAYNEEWMELSALLNDLPAIPVSETGFEFVGPVHPPGTEVGLPVVDQIVEAVSQQDRAALLSMRSLPEEGTLAPPAPITSLPCTDAVLPAADLEEHLDRFFRSESLGEDAGPPQLYAVVGSPPAEGQEAVYVAILAFEGGEGRQIWVAPDGSGIQWFGLGCGPTSPGELLQVRQGEAFFWFRPVLPEPLTPIL